MRSTQQAQLKNNLHKELRIKYRELFESQLAIHLLKHLEYFPAVTKLSQLIIKLMLDNKDRVLNTIKTNPKIIMELREPYFGGCFESKQDVSPETAYEKIISILSDKTADMSRIMQIQCIFVYRIYDEIEKNNDKKSLVSTLFPHSLFNAENRSRTEKEEVKATKQLGITHHPVFTKRISKSDREHTRALDKYEPNSQSAFFKSAVEKTMPTVCGPSGHTASLMLGAKLYGKLMANELKEYALASFAFLASGGNHSFYEVFSVANLLGVPFQTEDYSESVPDSIKVTNGYKNMQERYPQFLKF